MHRYQRVEFLRNAGELKIPITDITAIKWSGEVTVQDTKTGDEITIRKVETIDRTTKVQTITGSRGYMVIDNNGRASDLKLPTNKCEIVNQNGDRWVITKL